RYGHRVKEPLLGLLVAAHDEPGVLYRVAEVIFQHRANIEYIAGGARTGEEAELQIEVSGAADEARLTTEIEGLPGITRVTRVPTFERIYGKRVIVIGGGAQVGMVAQGSVSEATGTTSAASASRSTRSRSSARTSWRRRCAPSRACTARAFSSWPARSWA